jgi:hypothetical protein
LKAYKCNDLAPQPQLALPAQAIRIITDHYRGKHTPCALGALADLVTIAFFFLLCPREYDMPTSQTKTRMVQF